MVYSLEKLREVENRIDFALERPNLNSWSRTFLRDMRGRIAKYGKNVRFTEKQAKALQRLTGHDVNADLTSSPWVQRQNVVSVAGSQSPRRYSAFRQKKVRWSRGGSARTAVLAAVSR